MLHRKTNFFCFSLCSVLLFAVGLPLTAGAQAIPANPPANILEQVGDTLIQLVRMAQPNVVTIQPKPRTLVFPTTPPTLTDQQRALLSPEKQKAYDDAVAQSVHDVFEFINTARALARTSFTGSGFVIHGGFVVTTAEVADRIEEPTVIFSDGHRVEVEWVNSDAWSNIAVLKIAVPSDSGLNWADSQTVAPGAMAITIGSQGDFPRSASLGIISGLGRNGRSGPHRYENLIQFQGAVGAGGSGGPLLNARGELIGMVVAAPADMTLSNPRVKYEKHGPNGEKAVPETPPMQPFAGLSNMGFALASNDIRPITDILCRHEKRPQAGFVGMFLSSDMEATVPQIIGILPNSPAMKAGLLVGDIVTAINGQTFQSVAELRAFAGRIAANETLKITVRRASETKNFTLTAQSRQEGKGRHFK